MPLFRALFLFQTMKNKYKMKKPKNLFLILFLGFCFSVIEAQEKVKDTSVYREDQFYFGISMVFFTSSNTDLHPSGISRHLQWGFIRDIPFTREGQWAAGVGLGMAFNRYTTNFERTINEGGVNYRFIDNEQNDPFFISQSALELPLTLRWRNSTPTDYAFWRVYGGVSLQWFYASNGKLSKERFNIKNDLINWGATAHISVGYNTWNFYIGYSLNELFSSNIHDKATTNLDVRPIKIGLIFFVL